MYSHQGTQYATPQQQQHKTYTKWPWGAAIVIVTDCFIVGCSGRG